MMIIIMSTIYDKDCPSCPVCLENIIGPYSFGCGHTVDIGCFMQLKKKECPVCRFKLNNVDNYGINLMLEECLKTKIPHYEKLKKERLKFVKSLCLFRKYSESERYNIIKQYVTKYIKAHSHTCLLSDLAKDAYQTLSHKLGYTTLKSEAVTEPTEAVTEPTEAVFKLELYCILDKCHKYQITIDGKPHVIDGNNEDNLQIILGKLCGTIDHLTIIKIIGWTCGYVDEIAHSGTSILPDPFLDNNGREQLRDNLLSMKDFLKVPTWSQIANSDSDSDSDSDYEPDSDSDSDSALFLSLYE
jgi:hypothetical protein